MTTRLLYLPDDLIPAFVAWDRNDYVCAITFDVHRCNIDQMPEALA